MMQYMRRFALGSSLMERALRSSAITSMGFVGYQVLRLLSNLVLTRLLFPEAFGMMALISVVMMGLAMFSDVGVSPAIMQSKRGDDPSFLNTAWTIQFIRGICLWAVACALAYPAALLYAEPQLLQLLPIAALSLVINGLNPTKLETANRHLQAGRVTVIELAVQVIGLIIAILAAWATQSVWALVISGLAAALAHLILLHLYLPGPGNRFRLERKAAAELISFGKWIFLSTICGFFSLQGDKLIIGKYLALDEFGVYNIGYFLASFPLLMGGMVTRKVLIPIYRENPPGASRENYARLRKMRFPATMLLTGLLVLVAALGPWLVNLMYDPRYAAAGAVVALLAVMQIPQVIVLTYDQAALASGDSRRFFVLALSRAVLVFGALLVGLETYGLFGAILGLGLAHVLAYPVVVWLARHQQAWDPLHDAIFALLGGVATALIIGMHWTDIQALLL